MRSSKVIAALAVLTCLTAIAMACLLAWLVNGVSAGANALDEAKTKQAVHAMIAGLGETIGSLVMDNAALG